MPEQDLPDAADSGDTTREDAAEPPSPRAGAPEVTAPPAEVAAATAQVEAPVFAVSASDVPAVPSKSVDPPASPTPPPTKPARVRPIIGWRSFSGWFCLLWLLALAWLVSAAMHGPGPVTELPKAFLAKAAVASALAVILAFLVPVSLLDDSSHHARAWWVAWLWPPVMVLMLAADVAVIGGVTMKLMPLVQMLKKH